jgi:hypothetical protein
MADKGLITIYLNKEQIDELDRRCNYQRITRNEWVKKRVLSALGLNNTTKPV